MKVVYWLVASCLLLGARTDAAEVVMLETAGLCEFTVNRVVVRRATITGDRAAIVTLLVPRSVFYAHDCSFLLSPNPEKLTEIEWVVRERAMPIAASDRLAVLAATEVAVRIHDPKEFLAVAKSLQPQGGKPPGGPPGPPSGIEAVGGAGKVGDEKDACEAGSELCVSSEGELSMSVSCGELRVGMSTEGAVTIGVDRDGVEGSLTIGN